MIRTLDEAWEWSQSVDRLVRNMQRMAAKYWDRDELATLLERDGVFRDRTAASIEDDAKRVLDDLLDLSVLILFSVFEAEVRDLAGVDADRLIREVQHPAMLSGARDLRESIKRGSFGKVTSAYRPMDVNLTAQIDQIRDYRNWVAHGRRDFIDNLTYPERAIMRMR